MKIELFHAISDSDSAEIRRTLVQKNLAGSVDFRNIAYDAHLDALKTAAGHSVVPTLIIEGEKVLSGKSEILAWLSTK